MNNPARSDCSAHSAPGRGAPDSSAIPPRQGNDTGHVARAYIVTACFNAERTIADALESVVSQLEHVAGHVIIDGASTDGTLGVIERYASVYGDKLTVVSEPDSGIYDAMNKGISVSLSAAGPRDLIGTLNSDDRYEPGGIAAAISAANSTPDADVFFGDIVVLDATGEPVGEIKCSVPELTISSCSDGMPIEHTTMFVRADVYRRFGLYDTSYAIAGDYEFILRIAEAGVRSRHVEAVVTGFRFGGVSTAYESASFREAIRARIAHGASPAFEWSRYARRRVVGRIFRATKWIPGVARLQARHGASSRRDECGHDE